MAENPANNNHELSEQQTTSSRRWWIAVLVVVLLAVGIGGVGALKAMHRADARPHGETIPVSDIFSNLVELGVGDDATPVEPEVTEEPSATDSVTPSPSADESPSEGPQGYSAYGGGETNILLLGSDSRTTNGNPSAWSPDDARSDVMMLVQIEADRQHATVMSFTRNLAATIPGYGDLTLINAAYARGGTSLAAQTVQELTGVRIDHVAVLDFTNFINLVDTLGGITLTSVAEGTRIYSGKEALWWVRERKTLPHDDLDRNRRHQAFLRAIHDQMLSAEGLNRFGGAVAFYDLARNHVTLDNGFSRDELIGLAQSIGRIPSGNIAYVSFPYADTTRDANGSFIRNPNWHAAAPLMAALRQGNGWAYITSHAGELETIDSRLVE